MTDLRFTPQTIAVVQLGRLGDTILTTPLLDALRSVFPDARTTLIGSSAAATIARNLDSVDDVLEVSRGAAGLARAIVQLRSRAFDLYIDPKDHRSSTSRLLARSARANHVFAHTSNAPPNATSIPDADPDGHFVDRMLAPLAILAPNHSAERRPRLTIPAAATVEAQRIRAECGGGYVLVNISAGSPSRRWPIDHVVALAQWLSHSRWVVITSAPEDHSSAHAIAAMADRITAAITQDILEVAAIARGASLVVTPDTSIVHVASALDVPTVALYPSDRDNMRLFAPLASRHHALAAPVGGGVADITFDDVRSAVERLLS